MAHLYGVGVLYTYLLCDNNTIAIKSDILINLFFKNEIKNGELVHQRFTCDKQNVVLTEGRKAVIDISSTMTLNWVKCFSNDFTKVDREKKFQITHNVTGNSAKIWNCTFLANQHKDVTPPMRINQYQYKGNMYFIANCLMYVTVVNVPKVVIPTSGQKDVTFHIDNQNYNCISSKDTVYLEKNESLTVNVTGRENVNDINCFTTSGEIAMSMADYDQHNVFTKHLTDKQNGTWNCTILIRKGKDRNSNFMLNGNNYTRVFCEVLINIKDEILGMNPTNFYIMIGCVVGALVVIIIIIQTVVIIYYKSRVSRRSELSHLEQRPAPRDDTARYSSMPLRKSSRKRQSSGIYQSLENLRTEAKAPPNIKDRPRMPLPVFNESDDDGVYGGGKTLERIFSPEPPPVDTLPRRKAKKQKPKPAVKPKPVLEPQDNYDDMEDYDYADSDAHNSMNRQLIKKPLPIQPKPMKSDSPQLASRPIPPIQCVNTLSELDSVLKRRQMTARAQEPVNPEGGMPSSAQHNLPRRPVPPKENFPGPGLRGPQDVRLPNIRTVAMKPALETKPLPNTPWSQGPLASRYPQEETRASDNSRNQDIRPQRLADRFEERVQKPEPRPLLQRPDLARAPQTAKVLPIQMMMSPPLQRKPGQVSDEKPPVPGIRRPAPPPPEAESVYEPVAEGESSDDEEWKMEPLKPYNIYNI